MSAREEGGREAQEPGIVGAESMSGKRWWSGDESGGGVVVGWEEAEKSEKHCKGAGRERPGVLIEPSSRRSHPCRSSISCVCHRGTPHTLCVLLVSRLTHTHTLSLSLSFSLSHTHTLTLSFFLSLSLSLSLFHTHTRARVHTHTRARAHTQPAVTDDVAAVRANVLSVFETIYTQGHEAAT